jgi:S-formylglutathione hydrolase FrmB
MLILSACGEAQDTAVPSFPPVTPSGAMPSNSSPAADGSGSTAPNPEVPEATMTDGAPPSADDTPGSTEGVDGELDLATEGMEEVPSEPEQPLPAIAQPGFPEGSPPRLVPFEFVGPITGLPVLFNVYLPPGYDSSSASYPVLYDLHGLTDNRDTNPGPVVRSFEAAMRSAVVGPLIVVFPQSFAEAYYADARDGARPGETQILRELIPYVDQSFRTLAHRDRRGVSGFSMGGFGALAYATKYPDRFSVGIGYDSALDTWETLVARRAYIAAAAFGDDESYFDQISPWLNAERNAPVLAGSSMLRIVPGNQYRDFNESFRGHLTALEIPHEFSQADCPHDYNCLIEREGARSWAVIQAAFSKPATAP